MGLIVSAGATVYLDTNPLIYLTEGNPAFKASIDKLFVDFEAAQARFITSELAYTEALVLPLRNANAELVAAYERLFDTLVHPLPVSRQVLIFVAQLRAETPSLKTPDAIHLATATLAKADGFVSADAGIKNLPAFMRRFSI
jgi:predicted nucleic acid-binding protein